MRTSGVSYIIVVPLSVSVILPSPHPEDDIPERAVVAGESSDGGPLYVGRAHHDGGLYPGKVNPDHNCCYIAYGGEELSREEYDVNINIEPLRSQA